MEFKKHYAVPSKGAIMGIMGLQSLNFKRLTFKYGFSLFDLIPLVTLPFFHMVSRICRWSFSLFYRQQSLCFTCSQCTKAPVQWPTVPPLSSRSHKPPVQNAFKPLNPKTKKMNGSITLLHLSQLALVGIWFLIVICYLAWSALPIEKETKLQVSLLVGDLWVVCQD